MMAGYMMAGRPDRALEIVPGGGLETLLWDGEPADAITLALAGYAALKTQRRHSRRLEWSEDFAVKRAWLPDSAVIAAATMMRDGNADRALDWLLEAEHRGVPYFSSGLSIMAAEAESLAETYGLPAAADMAIRWRRLAATADYTSLSTALRINPLWDNRFGPEDGWLPLDAGPDRGSASASAKPPRAVRQRPRAAQRGRARV
jgi:hypothetical protein